MKNISILGSTGSIGTNTLEVVRALGGRVRVVGLTANRSIGVLKEQIEEFRPLAAAVADTSLQDQTDFADSRRDLTVFWGEEGLAEIAVLAEADLVVNALVGAAGIRPTLAAIEAGKDVAIANKESLVAAGGIIVKAARTKGVSLIPIDSEHSAIYQCIGSERQTAVKRIILTASGGPLVDMTSEEIAQVTASDALKHPNWNMGKKVTIDSATLLNKGFEVIEAHWLFGIAPERIEVSVERRSLVHSLVEFVDGSVMALLSHPDMRFPIQYALTCPERQDTGLPSLDLAAVGQITFEAPDFSRFPCLDLAYKVARKGGTAPAVLSAADEVAVDAFLSGRLAFGEIYSTLNGVLAEYSPAPADDLDLVLEADHWAREAARRIVTALSED